MSIRFNRRVALTIAKPVSGSFFDLRPNAVVIEDLRVVFQVEKSLEKKPNTCEVRVYNLSEESRASLQDKPIHIRLDVGYENDLKRLFSGDIRWSTSMKTSATWETLFQSGDGGRAYQFARVGKAFNGRIDLKDALKETVGSMGLKMPKNLDDAKELFKTFESGLVLEGPSQQSIDKLLESSGFGWSIQDGQFQAIRKNGHLENAALLVSPETGLVGTPELGAPEKKGESPSVVFQHLLLPDARCGSLVRLRSQSVTGTFRIDRLTHTGDTHGRDWYTQVEGKSI